MMIRANMATGHKRDAIWSEFTQSPDGRAKCNHCYKEMAGLVARMKKHFNDEHALAPRGNVPYQFQATETKHRGPTFYQNNT